MAEPASPPRAVKRGGDGFGTGGDVRDAPEPPLVSFGEGDRLTERSEPPSLSLRKHAASQFLRDHGSNSGLLNIQWLELKGLPQEPFRLAGLSPLATQEPWVSQQKAMQSIVYRMRF